MYLRELISPQYSITEIFLKVLVFIYIVACDMVKQVNVLEGKFDFLHSVTDTHPYNGRKEDFPETCSLT